ncbi:MAG: alpha-L-arabinofuranosidase C-terminal domain-containing protein, partial [Thermoguttaceae bacterium]
NSVCFWNGDMYGVNMSKPGAQEYYDSVFALMASWDLDFVKVDDLSSPYHKPEIEAIRKAIDKSGRPIVFSTSPGATPLNQGQHIQMNANMWRISDDFWDNWGGLYAQFARLNRWTPYRGPGHFPDADMLPLGNVRAWQSTGNWTNFTHDEQYTLMTLWSIARSPLIMGGNMPKNDDFTLSLMNNDEVIAVNQHSTNNKQVFAGQNNTQFAWVADVPGSEDKYVAIFNASPAPAGGRGRGRARPAPASKTAPAVIDPAAAQPAQISVSLADIGLTGPCKVRDLWAHKDLDTVSGTLSATVNSHGAVLYRVQPQRPAGGPPNRGRGGFGQPVTLGPDDKPAFADPPITITVQVDKPGAAISPILNGVFFEDINFAADGGLYPERIKNGSFEFADPMMGWRRDAIVKGGAVGGFGVVSDKPLNANNSHFLRACLEQEGEGLPLTNEGYRGIGVTQGAKFTFSVYARSDSDEAMCLVIELLGADSHPIAQPQRLSGFDKEWKKYACTIESTAADPKARLRIVVKGTGTLDLDMVSLFPQETFNNRPNGLRPDLAQLLKDLKPGFVRFPGGCIVEGRTLSQRYQWKTTIGDPAQRRLILNRWNVEFPPPRNAPDYYQSMGLGFFEYFQLCEDIGAKPLPILNCGMACQFNLAELVPLDQLDPYIQDALDLIEFANGPVASIWGAKRAAMGHPQPFNMTMIGIGNEQWGPQYIERYRRFAQAIKAKYAQMILVSGAGPEPADGRDDHRFSFAWSELRKAKADLIDEHFYQSPEWFYSQAGRYDRYDRNGPKVFAGEFAAHIRNKRPGAESNTWEAALAEAALMTGLERNGDVVQLASYAPLFAHVDAWQWNPNLIWFDNLRSMGTPSYYVQKLFSTNRGTTVLPIKLAGAAEKVFASASHDQQSGQIILKVVNAQPTAQEMRIGLAGALGVQPTGELQVLTASSLTAMNTLDVPTRVSPIAGSIRGLGPEFQHQFPAFSLTVIRISAARN